MAVENDWIVASVNNPSFTNEDFKDVLGMDLNNTQILPKEEYENKKFITENPNFLTESGEFNKDKFEQFYSSTLDNWGKFTLNEKLDNFEYSLFDTRAKANSKIKDPEFRFETVINPDRVTTGVVGWNQVGDRKLTPSEIAQTQKIYDPATNSYLDETPNDSALTSKPIKWVKSLFEDPLVIATWDEDGTHFDLASGQVVEHKKGQYKLNDQGTYYTEKLDGRSPVGKQVISAMDTITVDGDPINKYDFFDSDSLDKSVTGTVAKSIAAVAPMLYGPTAAVYSGLLIGRELCKTLPMLYGMTTALFGNEEDSSLLNTMAAYGEKFTNGTSDYAKTHTFSFENIGNMMADVAVQWGQQKLISLAVNKLRGGTTALKHADDLAFAEYNKLTEMLTKAVKEGKELPQVLAEYTVGAGGDWRKSLFGAKAIEKYMPAAEEVLKRNSRLGADAALAYMALVSNYDVYNTMLEHGTTKKEAAIVSWGSTLGMFGVDKYLGLGEMFFDDLEDTSKTALSNYSKKEAEKWAGTIAGASGLSSNTIDESKGFLTRGLAKAAQINSSDKEATLLRKGINIGRSIAEEFSNSVGNYKEGVMNHTLNAFGKAFGEGLEETTEELVTDTTKQLYEWAGLLGYDTSTKDVGAWDNAFDRYAMSFLGGAAGGGLFYGVGKVQEAIDNTKNPQAKDGENEVIYLLRQHKKNEIFDVLKELHDKGKLGSTRLGIRSEVNPKTGEREFLTVKDGEKSLNDIIYDMMTNVINLMDGYINEYGANLSEDELFKLMVLGDERLLAIKSKLGDAGYSSGYMNDFLTALLNVVSLRSEIDSSNKAFTDAEQRRKNAEAENDQEALTKAEKDLGTQTEVKSTLQLKLAKSLQELNDFLTGKNSMYFARKTVWLADPYLSSHWTYNTFDQWLYRKKDGMTADKLSAAEKEKFYGEYLIDLNTRKKLETDEAFESFLGMEKDFSSYLNNLELNLDKVTEISEKYKELENLRKEVNDIMSRGLVDWDTQLEGESDEDYRNRDNYLAPDLSEEERTKALESRQNRLNKIILLNLDYLNSLENLIKLIENITSSVEKTNGLLDPLTYRKLRSYYSGLNATQAYLDAVVKSLKNVNVDGDTSIYSDLVLDKMFKITKDVLEKALEPISKLYSSIKSAYDNNFLNIAKITAMLSSGNPDDKLEAFREILDNLDYLDNILEGVVPSEETDDLIDPSDEELSLFVQKLESEDKLWEVLQNSEKYLASLSDLIGQLFNSDINEEVSKYKLNEISEAIKSSKNYSELLDNLSAIINDDSIFPVEDSIKENITDIVMGIKKGIDDSMTNISKSKNKEELENNIDLFNKDILSNIKSVLSTLLYNSSYSNFEESEDSEEPKKVNTSETLLDYKSVNDAINKISEELNKISESLKNELSKQVDEDSFIKFISTLKQNLLSKNPISDIAKIVAEKYGVNEEDIDAVLSKILDRWDSLEDTDDFTLEPNEESTLQYLDHVFETLSTFFHQSSKTPGWLSPFGHAKFWNDFASKNKDIVGEEFHLPELDSGIALVFLNEIQQYRDEIKSWQKIHATNAVNKERQFSIAGQKLEETKILFYKNNIKAFRTGLSINDVTLDILDDISDGDTALSIETRLANNLYDILNKGVSFLDYLEKTKILENLLSSELGLEELLDLDHNAALLDDKLSIENLTGYLKVNLFLTALLNNSSKFERLNKENVLKEATKEDGTKIAPISIQKLIIQSGKGFINGSYIIGEFYKYISKKLGNKLDSKAILDHIMVIKGVGGAGKTKAVINQIVLDLEGKELWAAAPKKSQVSNLTGSLGKDCDSFDKTELLAKIITNPNDLDKSLKNILKQQGDDNFKKVKSPGGVSYYVDTGAIKLNKAPEDLKALVIDEYTQFSNYELLLINRWGRENNVQILLSGDDNQTGTEFSDAINYNNSFNLFISPKLKTSLRESNIHVQNNNAVLDKIIDNLYKFRDKFDIIGKDEEKELDLYLKDLFSKSNLTYYLDDTKLNGTIVTKEIDDLLIKVLKGSKSIAFVGDSSSSKIFKQLKDAEISIEDDAIFKTIGDILSLEFDYVIFDDKIEVTEKQTRYGDNVSNLVRKLNTLNTRGKLGVIIIDNDFSSVIGCNNTKTTTTASAKTISDAVNSFIDKEIKRLLDLEFDGKYHDLSEITKDNSSKETPPIPVEETSEEETAEEETPSEETPSEESLPEEETTVEEESKEETLTEEEPEEPEKPLVIDTIETTLEMVDTITKDENNKESINESIKEETEEENNSDEAQSTIDVDLNLEYNDPRFKLGAIGYFMPILGGFIREKVDEKTNRTIKIDNLKVGKVQILEDLSAMATFNGGKLIDAGKELTIDLLMKFTNTLQKFVKLLATYLVKPDYVGAKETVNWFIAPDHLLEVLSGTSKVRLADGRTEGVYLEASPYDERYRLTGLGYADDSEDKMTIDGGDGNRYVYRYVLRFKPTNTLLDSRVLEGFRDNYEFAITLSLAASPNGWGIKLNKIDHDIVVEKNTDRVKELESERQLLNDKIEKYKKYLYGVRSRGEKGVKVKLNGAFCKIRGLDYQVRFLTLAISDTAVGRAKNNKGKDFNKFERGWSDRGPGKYKVMSDLYILGSDLDSLGIKASNSGKVVVLVSDFDYKSSELLQIYKEEKKAREEAKGKYKTPCTVRMILLDNAGINWSSLTNKNYNQLYYSAHKDKDGNSVTHFPFKSEVMGYRFITAMWNWRADLINFLKAYDKAYKDYTDDEVHDIIAANDEIYFLNYKPASEEDEKASPEERYIRNAVPEDGSDLESPEVKAKVKAILDKYNVTAEEVMNLRSFNNKTCKDLHTFRLGGSKNGKCVQRINVDPKEYYGKSKIPSYIAESGVIGLAITPKLAREYLSYIQGIFKTFSNNDANLKLDQSILIDRNGIVSEYKETDRINGELLGTLSSKKEPGSSRAGGKYSFTNFLDGRSSIDKIEIRLNDEETPYLIKFDNETTSKRLLSLFMSATTHLYNLIKNAVFFSREGTGTKVKGSLKIYTDPETYVKLDYSEILDAALKSVGILDLNKGSAESQLLYPDDENFRFEFGDMFDLMLHGTLADVSTHHIEYDKDTHRVTGGRDDHHKISGAMFPRGMFIDPRFESVISKGESTGKTELFSTKIDPRLLLQNTTTELVFDYELPSFASLDDDLYKNDDEFDDEGISEEEDEQIDYSLNSDLEINNIESLPEVIDKNTIIGSKTWQLIVDEAGGTILEDSNRVKIGDTEYNVKINNDSISLVKYEKPSISNNTTEPLNINDDAQMLLSLSNYEVNSRINIGDQTLGEYVLSLLSEETKEDLTEDDLNYTKDGSHIQVSVEGEELGTIDIDTENNTILFSLPSKLVKLILNETIIEKTEITTEETNDFKSEADSIISEIEADPKTKDKHLSDLFYLEIAKWMIETDESGINNVDRLKLSKDELSKLKEIVESDDESLADDFLSDENTRLGYITKELTDYYSNNC